MEMKGQLYAPYAMTKRPWYHWIGSMLGYRTMVKRKIQMLFSRIELQQSSS
jgi:hypothetical protein